VGSVFVVYLVFGHKNEGTACGASFLGQKPNKRRLRGAGASPASLPNRALAQARLVLGRWRKPELRLWR